MASWLFQVHLQSWVSSPEAASTGPASEESASQPKPDEEKGPKGHGRNGVAAFTNAQHINHELKPSIIGTVCEDCGPGRGAGRMSPYREKVIIRIVGQPLYDENYVIAVHRDAASLQAAIDQALVDLRESGELDALLDRWL